MMRVAIAAQFLGFAFLLATLVASVWRAFQRRDPARLDVALWTVGLVAPVVTSGHLALRLSLNLLLPFFLLRLVRHFCDVPRALARSAIAVAVAAGIIRSLLVGPQAQAFVGWVYLYLALALLGAAAGLVGEVARASGIRERRLLTLVGAAGLLGAGFIIAAFGTWAGDVGQSLVERSGTLVLHGAALIGFFFALATPRSLLARWRRAEQAAYLERTSSRDPEERGARAADDLLAAAIRGVGGTATLVALRAAPGSDTLVVRAASDPSMVGRELTTEGGLLHAVLKTGEPFMDAPIACEPGLAELVASHDVRVLVAPVQNTGAPQGVVVAVLRRGALFPDDDLSTLTQFGRNAATALEHAALIAERRAHERRAAARRLRDVEERIGLMLDSITDYAMLVLEADGQVAAWHHGAEHIFGYTKKQIAEGSAHVLFDLTPELLRARLDEASAAGRIEWEGPCRRFDGSTFVGLTTIRPLVNEPEQPPGYVAVTRDVTERRHLEDRLRQSQKMEAIGQLAGGVAHDFNNLLTAILGYADWLGDGLKNDPRREQVGAIQKAAERAADLTRQLLAFSRRQMLQPSAINLSLAVNDLIPMLRRIIGERIEIIDATAPGSSWVMGDRSQIEQVVLNLTVNARDAMPDGGRLIFRTSAVVLGEAGQAVAGLAPGPHVELEVTDTGSGMDEATRLRVFEPFFTTKDVGRGTGLGLSTVYGIVQQMSGAIDVESEPGRGTTFRLHFPLAPAGETPEPVDAAAPLARGTETLLLVEDDYAVRTYLSSVLESHGYRVIAAEHAKSALALTRSLGERIDLVISDVVMPGSTGPELVELLGQTRPGLPALFISGDSHGSAAERVAAEAAVLLQKPFSSADLLSKVRQILSAA
jgi:PAS domain S-box-containing protein